MCAFLISQHVQLVTVDSDFALVKALKLLPLLDCWKPFCKLSDHIVESSKIALVC
jgi:hypothetical protein